MDTQKSSVILRNDQIRGLEEKAKEQRTTVSCLIRDYIDDGLQIPLDRRPSLIGGRRRKEREEAAA